MDITKKKYQDENGKTVKLDIDALRRQGMVFQRLQPVSAYDDSGKHGACADEGQRVSAAQMRVRSFGALGPCRFKGPRGRVSDPNFREDSSEWPLCVRPWEPEVMLFDEPTSASDPEMVGEVLDVMKKLAHEGHDHGSCNHDDGLRERGRKPVLFMADGKLAGRGERRRKSLTIRSMSV